MISMSPADRFVVWIVCLETWKHFLPIRLYNSGLQCGRENVSLGNG